MPPNPRDWIGEDHLANQVLDVVGELDVTAYFASYGRDGRGAPAFSPLMMVSVLLYAWMCKIYSSRKISALCRNDVGARVISGGCFPDHRTINNFRNRHQDALNDLFKQSVDVCRRSGMIDMVAAALDGSKIAASASKRKAMSYGHMVDEEAQLEAELIGYFKRAQQEDAEDDARYGAENEGPIISDDIKRRQSRLAKIREAKAALEAEAQAAAEAKRQERQRKEEAAAAKGKKLPGKAPKIDPTPKETAQRSFTDPESRIMKGGNGSYMQAYNAQAVVDSQCQVIVACQLSQQAADAPHLPEMLNQTIANVGAAPEKLLADPGYFSEENVKAAEALRVVALIPPDRERTGTPNEPAPELSPEQLEGLSPAERMRRLVSTEAGRQAYAKRKGTVEPVFGQTKGCAGHPGFLGFLRRGFEKCTAEWQWVCASHNILKYIRHKTADPGDAAPKSGSNGSKRAKVSVLQTELAYVGG